LDPLKKPKHTLDYYHSNILPTLGLYHCQSKHNLIKKTQKKVYFTNNLKFWTSIDQVVAAGRFRTFFRFEVESVQGEVPETALEPVFIGRFWKKNSLLKPKMRQKGHTADVNCTLTRFSYAVFTFSFSFNLIVMYM
jgi:hypothetical protein